MLIDAEKLSEIKTDRALLAYLKGLISPETAASLNDAASPLVISAWNRETLLRMLAYGSEAEREISPAAASELARSVKAYLEQYMAEAPEGHDWIIISCLFLSFIVNEPMHPQAAAHWEKIGENEYLCPMFEPGSASTCRWCVCLPRT